MKSISINPTILSHDTVEVTLEQPVFISLEISCSRNCFTVNYAVVLSQYCAIYCE